MESQMSEEAAPQAEVDVFNGETPTLAEFNNYRETGEVPERFKPEPAESEPAEQPEAQAESEPEPEPEQQEKPRRNLSASERIAQLNSSIEKLWEAEEPDTIKIAQLEATIARIEDRSGKKRKTEPAPVAQQPIPQEGKPTVDDKKPDGSPRWNTYEDFVEGLADWKADQRQKEWEQKQAQREQVRELESRIKEGEQVYGEGFREIANEVAGEIGQDKDIPLIVKQRIAQSDLMTHLMFTIGSDPDELAKFAKLAKTNQFKALDYIALSENAIREELEPARNGKGQFESPAKPKTAAPKPVSTVSGTTSGAFDVSDESLSADEWFRQRNKQLAAKR